MAKVKRCGRCDRRLRNEGTAADWAVALDPDGASNFKVPTEIWCPSCTSVEEHVQREINDSTVDYLWRGDRVLMWPKSAAANN
jgi:hypothetical protein